MSPEIEKALKLADRLLDEPYTDPDDDLRLLARQLIRTKEALSSHHAHLKERVMDRIKLLTHDSMTTLKEKGDLLADAQHAAVTELRFVLALLE